MTLTPEQLENILASMLEHGIGFVRVNLRDIEHLRVTVKQDGPDVLITSYEEGRLVTDAFPIVDSMGS